MTATILNFAGARSPDAKPRAMSKKMPWMKFYPGDWRVDPAVRGVSFAARGLWIDMLTLMHEAKPRGVLMQAGRVVDAVMLSRLLGGSPAEVGALLDELEAAEVFSRKKNGAIYSRRMELDEARSQKNTANGRRGGNPALKPNSDLTGDTNSNSSILDSGPENRGRIDGESDENRVRANPEKITEIAGSVNPGVKAKSLEARIDKKEDTPIVPLKTAQEMQAIGACITAWNNLAGECGLAKVQHVTGPRRSKLLARLGDIGGMPGWFATCDKVRQSAFLRGQSSEWRVSFDWLLSPTNIAKVLEGNYDDRKQSGARNAKQSVADAMADERRRILESAGAVERQGDDHDGDGASPGVRPGGSNRPPRT